MNPSLKLSLKLSFGEEVANSVTHAVGALLMLILLPITAIHSFQDYNVTAVV
ncbi:TPA: hemolysin III family protein, partial [Streptococcus suis]|nr:hemolysin III family protein [Streptococcus suis]